ncbi:MAG: ABC transporter ATP-binding protein [Planctomycetota bacterium]
MPQTVIDCQDIKKRYRLGQTASPDTLRDALTGVFRRDKPDATDDDTPPANDREFWALKGVSFQVQRGECLGIIGHNGAGKSTLLKVLSRITEPTAGRIEMQGRVAALLEVGTGFHPELTGLENTYLNGSILGMSRKEVKAKLADIVDFAGTEKFMNTPVKRYSSGMRVRLGFAVAAHLNPEILIIDEVLAVGDVAFQAKCVSHMKRMVDSGHTVMFVSHQIPMVRSLCTRAIVMSSGEATFDGETPRAIERYNASVLGARSSAYDEGDTLIRQEPRLSIIDAVQVLHGDTTERPDAPIVSLDEANVQIVYSFKNESLNVSMVRVSVYFEHDDVGTALSLVSAVEGEGLEVHPSGRLTVRVASLPLTPGRYRVRARVLSGERVIDEVVTSKAFMVACHPDYLGRVQLDPFHHGTAFSRAAWHSEPQAVPL